MTFNLSSFVSSGVDFSFSFVDICTMSADGDTTFSEIIHLDAEHNEVPIDCMVSSLIIMHWTPFKLNNLPLISVFIWQISERFVLLHVKAYVTFF